MSMAAYRPMPAPPEDWGLFVTAVAAEVALGAGSPGCSKRENGSVTCYAAVVTAGGGVRKDFETRRGADCHKGKAWSRC